MTLLMDALKRIEGAQRPASAVPGGGNGHSDETSIPAAPQSTHPHGRTLFLEDHGAGTEPESKAKAGLEHERHFDSGHGLSLLPLDSSLDNRQQPVDKPIEHNRGDLARAALPQITNTSLDGRHQPFDEPTKHNRRDLACAALPQTTNTSLDGRRQPFDEPTKHNRRDLACAAPRIEETAFSSGPSHNPAEHLSPREADDSTGQNHAGWSLVPQLTSTSFDNRQQPVDESVEDNQKNLQCAAPVPAEPSSGFSSGGPSPGPFPAREDPRPLAEPPGTTPLAPIPVRKRPREFLLFGVLPLFLVSVLAGAYVFQKVAIGGNVLHENLPFDDITLSDRTFPPPGVEPEGSLPKEAVIQKSATYEKKPPMGEAPVSRGYGQEPKAGFVHGADTPPNHRHWSETPSPPMPGPLPDKHPRHEGPSPQTVPDSAGQNDVAGQNHKTPHPVSPIRITIIRSPAPASPHAAVESALMTGLAVFEAGDNPAAIAAYREVLAKQPGNRDALLGLAAIAGRQRQWESAMEYYLEILHRTPTDTAARIALLGVQANLDPAVGRYRLERWLEREPGAPHLYFYLGNLHMRQSHWPEAREAYLRAYRGDGTNADYAHNLAISLDHLGKRENALGYYRRALALSGGQTRPVGFDPEVVRRRIRQITGSALRKR
ncbi:MAG: Tetratricopeptide repeat-containing protein [Candidatus Kentron sp. G]|nr:MAG: Tetratricopeptide repeat-containing protein [Candidatus Kentron sp. G]VFN01944.1 MAG: Tetratricopeptide repeat-containing protein [Candidatus Kentron sp. G]VFN02271.1 MAG: Tetratricopeptide repeat-containing protein [Candidatus Kentron sp. G]